MKNKFLATSVSLLFLYVGISSSFSQTKKNSKYDKKVFRYEIECIGIGVQGTYLIKVWTYSKKAKLDIAQSKKNAVHGVIFKGFAGGGQGCTSQKAFVNDDVEVKNSEFFGNFFSDTGDYNKYVSISNDGTIDSDDLIKIGKEYKIGIVVSIMKDQLRSYLEKAGIIKALDSGF